jgi:hypothetical protein
MNDRQLVEEMKRRFPWLGTDDEADGSETISELSDWYEELTEPV